MGLKLEGNLQNALMEEMKTEQEEVIRRIPKDTRALSQSTELFEGVRKGSPNRKGIVAATITVGNDLTNPKTGRRTADYAIQVHEDLEAHHNEGQAKFLESTLKEAAPYMADRVIRRLDKKLG
jgi:hypothetical protein